MIQSGWGSFQQQFLDSIEGVTEPTEGLPKCPKSSAYRVLLRPRRQPTMPAILPSKWRATKWRRRRRGWSYTNQIENIALRKSALARRVSLNSWLADYTDKNVCMCIYFSIKDDCIHLFNSGFHLRRLVSNAFFPYSHFQNPFCIHQIGLSWDGSFLKLRWARNYHYSDKRLKNYSVKLHHSI